jgi:hypothetical protein
MTTIWRLYIERNQDLLGENWENPQESPELELDSKKQLGFSP